MNAKVEVIDIPAKFLGEAGVIRLLGPVSERLPTAADLFVGGYGRPFVLDDGRTRRLHFDMRFVQSAMRIADPYVLEIPYTRKMMAFLLFVPDPSDILIVGLGGGSLAKFCHRYLPGARITVVEANPDVIALRHQFAVPEDERLVIVQADAAEYLPAGAADMDVILLDAFDAEGIAPTFGNAAFYQSARRRLRQGGVLVSNLVGSQRRCIEHVRRLSAAFDRQLHMAQVPVDCNRLVFACDEPLRGPLGRRLEQNAATFGRDFPLDLRRMAHWINNSDIDPYFYFD